MPVHAPTDRPNPALAAPVARPLAPRRPRLQPGGPPGRDVPLRRLFWIACAVLIIFVAVKAPGQPLESALGALLIIGSAMLPCYMWVSGSVRGLPLFPASALSSIWTFGLPLVLEHPVVTLFAPWNQFVAALTVTGFNLIGTLTWYLVARRVPRPPKVCWMMDEGKSELFFLLTLTVCAGWQVADAAGWIRLASGVDSLSRAISIAAESMACFVLSYRLGRRQLTPPVRVIFFVVLGILMLADLPSLLLISAMALLTISALAYIVSSKRLPWRVAVAALCIFTFLHLGKADMREKHWHQDVAPTVQPWQYPTFVSEWIGTSIQAIHDADNADDKSESLLERASLMHWLLYIQMCTPNLVPYLNGATYAVIPEMFVPRIFDANKPASHEATYLLAIAYGVQTREDTETTTIAFGLVNEACANFGYLGVAGLAVVLAAFYGQVSYWARRMPILSFRGLFAILISSFTFQAEYTSTYYIAALFQLSIVLLAFSVVFMRRQAIDKSVSLFD